MCVSPTVIAVAVVIPLTASGAILPSPQHCTVPLLRTAQDWLPPAAIAVAVVMPLTGTGVEESILVPFPSWPMGLAPQHCTVPLLKMAQVCQPPAFNGCGGGDAAHRHGDGRVGCGAIPKLAGAVIPPSTSPFRCS